MFFLAIRLKFVCSSVVCQLFIFVNVKFELYFTYAQTLDSSSVLRQFYQKMRSKFKIIKKIVGIGNFVFFSVLREY